VRILKELTRKEDLSLLKESGSASYRWKPGDLQKGKLGY